MSELIAVVVKYGLQRRLRLGKIKLAERQGIGGVVTVVAGPS
jgi:hypothetical protein